MKTLAASTIAAIALCAGSAQAQVDQRNTVTNASGSASTTFRAGQSFTPTLSGLNYVTLNLNSNSASTGASASVTVFQGAGFGGTNLGTSGVVAITGTTNQSYTFSFANMVALTPNSTYTFAMSTQSGSIGFRASTSNPYAGGNYYYQNGANAEVSGAGIDLVFSEGIAAAPEPATWALMIVGFGVAGGALRRRQGAPDRQRPAAAAV